uniref:NADH-ubiquinone oxidoreductase chain 6 n=1 Tax=Erionota torus TaxID=218728 RepID=A0A8E5KI66_9NEOP|nr:NADH dehydrogenase subunit 6 [Erionota torus]
MNLFLSFNLIMMSLLMLFLKHPLSMGLMILIQTFLTCLISGMIINTYWFSYILFLTFMGGLLVLFIYISSIASNELFKFSFTNKSSIFIFISILLSSILFFNNLKWMNFNFNNEMKNSSINLFIFFNNEYNINLTKLYNNQNYFLMIMLIIYLLITLITVVKITNIFYGPLRSFI